LVCSKGSPPSIVIVAGDERQEERHQQADNGTDDNAQGEIEVGIEDYRNDEAECPTEDDSQANGKGSPGSITEHAVSFPRWLPNWHGTVEANANRWLPGSDIGEIRSWIRYQDCTVLEDPRSVKRLALFMGDWAHRSLPPDGIKTVCRSRLREIWIGKEAASCFDESQDE